MRELPETSELLTFVRTVEARSISRAARELGVPRPTVGRRLARLEEKLGARLLRRTTRTMALTEAGEALYARARSVVTAVLDAQDAVAHGDDVPRGLLRVSTPPMPTAGLGELVARFLERCPEVRLELETSTRYVDLVAGGFDVAIRAASDLAPGLIARTLARTRLVAVASPAYLAAHGTPKRPSELVKHRCLVGYARGEHPATHWPTDRGRVRVSARFASNDLMALREAALRGLGVAMLPTPTVWHDVESGALVPVLPARLVGTAHIAVVWSDRAHVPAAVRAFVDEVVRWAAEVPAFAHAAKVPGGVEAPRAKRAKGEKRGSAKKTAGAAKKTARAR